MLRALGAALLLLAAVSAKAALVDVSIDDKLFGRLDQHDIEKCPNSSCGPAAAVNSFVFLQNMYPGSYGTNLVGDPNEYLNLVNTGTTLLDPKFMNTDCADCGPGTLIQNFITGKQAYLEQQSPGKTTYKGQLAVPWPGANPKPPYVQDNGAPTIPFLTKELSDKADVELLLSLPGGGHYVTLTGLQWDPAALTGSITIVDPNGGVVSPESSFQSGDGALHINYVNKDSPVQAGTIFAAISESATPPTVVVPDLPEPDTYAMLLAGFAVITLACRRRSLS